MRYRIGSGEAAAFLSGDSLKNALEFTAPNGEVEDLLLKPFVPANTETYGTQGKTQTSNENTSLKTSTDSRDKGVYFETMFPHFKAIADDLLKSTGEDEPVEEVEEDVVDEPVIVKVYKKQNLAPKTEDSFIFGALKAGIASLVGLVFVEKREKISKPHLLFHLYFLLNNNFFQKKMSLG